MEEMNIRVRVNFISQEDNDWQLSVRVEHPCFSYEWTKGEPYLYTYDELMGLANDDYMTFVVESNEGRGDGELTHTKIPSALVRDKLRAELDKVVPAGYKFAI